MFYMFLIFLICLSVFLFMLDRLSTEVNSSPAARQTLTENLSLKKQVICKYVHAVILKLGKHRK